MYERRQFREIQPEWTICETCDKRLKTKDWRSHSQSKAHRKNTEVAEKALKHGGATVNANDTSNGAEWAVMAESSDTGVDWVATNNGNVSGGGNYGVGAGNGDNNCRNCGQPGHFSRECTQPKKGGDGICYNCGQPGHMSRECTEPRKERGGGGSGRACYNCGSPDHMSRECPEPRKPREGGGGGSTRECHNCKQVGHMSKDCPEPRVMRCRNCDEEGHVSKECPKPKDWSRVKCSKCGNMGHGVKRCPEPIKEDTGDGGWNDNSTSAATGGWADESTSNKGASGGWGDSSANADGFGGSANQADSMW